MGSAESYTRRAPLSRNSGTAFMVLFSRPLEERGLSRAQGWTIAVVATLVMTVSYTDRQTLSALAPTVRAELGIDHAQYGWLTAAFSIAYLVMAPLSGALVDRAGARRGLLVAILFWSLVSALHALAPSFAILFALRIALGAAEAPSFPGAAQAVRRTLPAADRSAGFGLIFTGSSIGAMFAAPLAIAFKVRFGWRFAFLGTAAVGLLWLPLWLFVSSRRNARVALSTAEETRAPAELASRRRLLFDPAVQRAVLLVIACAPAINFSFNWLSQYLVSAWGLNQDDLGTYLAVPPVFFDAGAVGFGLVATLLEGRVSLSQAWARSGLRASSSHTTLVMIAAAASASIALVPWAPGPWAAIGLASLSMAGGGGLYALLTADVLARVPPSQVSTTGGLTAAAQSLAFVVANPLVGKAVDQTRSYNGVLVALGGLVLPGALIWTLWPVPPRPPP
jgi:ACS family hexuronate transporter-like MFS transporter